MNETLFSGADFAPAEIQWNKLVLDPALPHQFQLGDYYDGLLFAKFPNGVGLDIAWHPKQCSGGAFVVALNQNPDAWEPFATLTCPSLPELRKGVAGLVELARRRTLRYLLGRRAVGADEIWTNQLVLDPEQPLDRQLDALGSELFEAAYMIGGYVLTVGWEPPHVSGGAFTIRLYQSPTEWVSQPLPYGMAKSRQRDPKSWRLLAERRAESLSNLPTAVEELARMAREQTVSDPHPGPG